MKVLVIGASTNPSRASHSAVHLLRSQEYETVAIGRSPDRIGSLTMLTGKPCVDDVDTVTLYVNPMLQEDLYEYVLGLHPKRVIFNPGTENHSFYKILEEAEIPYEAACTLVLLQTGQF